MSRADVAYCRAALPRVSRTFAINIRLLAGSLGRAVRVAYLLCRAADTLEDSWPGPPAAIGARFQSLLDALAGSTDAAESLARDAAALPAGRADLDLVAHLPVILRVFGSLPPRDRDAVAEAVSTMIQGMRHFSVRAAERVSAAAGTAPYLDTEAELHEYCFVVAGVVGVMLTRLFNTRWPAQDPEINADREMLAPIVGEALQLTNILLDWPRDLRRGRCYVPAAWLDEYRITPADLTQVARAGVKPAAKRLESLARAALGRVPEYLDLIPPHHVRYRLFCLWPAQWALASIRNARRDPEFPWGPRRPRLPRGELWSAALRSGLGGHSGGAVRRLLATEGN